MGDSIVKVHKESHSSVARRILADSFLREDIEAAATDLHIPSLLLGMEVYSTVYLGKLPATPWWNKLTSIGWKWILTRNQSQLRKPKDISYLFFWSVFTSQYWCLLTCQIWRGESRKIAFLNIPNEERSRSPSHFRHRISNHLRDSTTELRLYSRQKGMTLQTRKWQCRDPPVRPCKRIRLGKTYLRSSDLLSKAVRRWRAHRGPIKIFK